MALQALLTASTGLEAQSKNVDVIANNLANINTTGYKSTRANFEDLLYQQMRRAGSTAFGGNRVPTGIQVGIGTRFVSTQKMFHQGALQPTANPLDLAIEGAGFFQVVIDEAGTVAYTRDGSFTKNQEGAIVNGNGFLLEPSITIPDTSTGISISPTGVVESIDQDGSVTEVGQIQLAKFINPAGLEARGQNIFVETPASGDPITGNPDASGMGALKQHTLEGSNVSPVEALVELIKAQRAFEINSETVQTADEMLQAANNLRR